MKLLLFGGSFNPPHIGHLQLLKNSIQAVEPDMVMVMPSGVPPHKEVGSTPAVLRLAMCECFVPLFKNVVVSDIEIRRQGKSYTLDTVYQIKKLVPNADIYFCIGSDSLIQFTAWYKYQELLRHITLVVQNRDSKDVRPAYKAAEILKAEGGKIIFASGDIEKLSSSDIRHSIANGSSVAGKIPPPASEIVKEYGLYKSKVQGLPS